jgi:multiple sugar transport system permease protein
MPRSGMTGSVKKKVRISMSKTTKKLLTRHSRMQASEARTAYFCLIPAMIGLTFITYLPLLGVFGISLFNWSGLSKPKFIGIRNYVKLFTTDPYMLDSIRATLYFSLLAVIGGMIFSLFIAMLLNRRIPARGFWRAVFYVPYVLPATAIYVGWSWLYEGNFGFLIIFFQKWGLIRCILLPIPDMLFPLLH